MRVRYSAEVPAERAASRGVAPDDSASAEAASTPKPAPVCVGSLIVTNVPPHAEVLLREGQAPVDVEKMPVGARLEFVATAEGYAPKRVVVPAGATWDHCADGKPRFETAVQEVFAVTVLGRRYPELINDDEKLLQNSFVVPTECLGEVAATVRK